MFVALSHLFPRSLTHSYPIPALHYLPEMIFPKVHLIMNFAILVRQNKNIFFIYQCLSSVQSTV